MVKVNISDITSQVDIPIEVFDLIKREIDPDHDNLEEFKLFYLCVQSDILPENVIQPNIIPQIVNGRFLFKMVVSCWLEEDKFICMERSYGNPQGKQLQFLGNLTANGYNYIGPVPAEYQRSYREYVSVDAFQNIKNIFLSIALLSTSF